MKVFIKNARYCIFGKFASVNLSFHLLLLLVGIFKMRRAYTFSEFLLSLDIEKRKII